jgi:hypothetical protein
MCLVKLQLPLGKMAVKPLLTQATKDKRLAFCKSFRNWTMEQWNKVMFSDESYFKLSFANSRGLCRRSSGSGWCDHRFTKKTVKHPPKLMAWGCFS